MNKVNSKYSFERESALELERPQFKSYSYYLLVTFFEHITSMSFSYFLQKMGLIRVSRVAVLELKKIYLFIF